VKSIELNVASPGPFWSGDNSFVEKFTRSGGKQGEVIIDPDYKLMWVFLASAAVICLIHPDKSCAVSDMMPFCPPDFYSGLSAFIHVWFGLFMADRAKRIRVIFDKNYFQMRNLYEPNWPYHKNDIEGMTERPMNYVIGGMNKWKYDSFVNWGFFPSVHLPVLVYFKETQTPKDKWNVGPGSYDYRNNGMVHFFPAFGNSYQIKEQFEKRIGPSKSWPEA